MAFAVGYRKILEQADGLSVPVRVPRGFDQSTENIPEIKPFSRTIHNTGKPRSRHSSQGTGGRYLESNSPNFRQASLPVRESRKHRTHTDRQ